MSVGRKRSIERFFCCRNVSPIWFIVELITKALDVVPVSLFIQRVGGFVYRNTHNRGIFRLLQSLLILHKRKLSNDKLVVIAKVSKVRLFAGSKFNNRKLTQNSFQLSYNHKLHALLSFNELNQIVLFFVKKLAAQSDRSSNQVILIQHLSNYHLDSNTLAQCFQCHKRLGLTKKETSIRSFVLCRCTF